MEGKDRNDRAMAGGLRLLRWHALGIALVQHVAENGPLAGSLTEPGRTIAEEGQPNPVELESAVPTPRETLAGLLLLLVVGCGPDAEAPGAGSSPSDPGLFVSHDSTVLLRELRALSHDSMMGRRTGTPGAEMARELIRSSMEGAGLQEPPGGWVQSFSVRSRSDTATVVEGKNVLGYVAGRDPERAAIVLTAHFDHLGIRRPLGDGREGAPVDSIFNGADDNASGTAAVLSMARYFAAHPPLHTMVFAALDAEEMGLRGARAFVDSGWPESIALNVNLDMVSRSDSLLFAAGTHHYPFLRTILETVQPSPPVVLAFGHDEPGVEGVQDWTGSSDHSAFHARNIPFVYFGVEDHPDYHRASDEFAAIEADFFLSSVRTILSAVLALDQQM